MNPIHSLIEGRLSGMSTPAAVILPGGTRLGAVDARVVIRLHDQRALARLAAGDIGRVGEDYVEGRLELEGSMRDLMAAAAEIVGSKPVAAHRRVALVAWWRNVWRRAKSLAQHTPEQDAKQIQFHYDVSDDFYALWLDPRRVYSCAYFQQPAHSLAQAQEAKLDHICRKLMLRPGERFLDIGAGWGGLLLWAAEHYDVHALGITLSKNQHAHVNRLIADKGLQGRVRMEWRDYRALPEDQAFDKIASVGMFEHVGHAQMVHYFDKIRRLLVPGGLVMNHGITAGGTRNHQLGAGMGDFIEKYIFPGGELMHVSDVMASMAEAALEPLDTENLRPHYARTLWAWSDGLESQLERARAIAGDKVVRAYRLYLAGCAMSFERGWISLFQILGSRPDGKPVSGPMDGAQSGYPFNRGYMYREVPKESR